MSYSVHNFRAGDTIASQALNQMDAQILNNANDIASHGTTIGQHTTAIGTLEGDMEAAETAIGALEDGMEAAQGDIEDLQDVQETVSTGSSGTVTLVNHETKVLSGTPSEIAITLPEVTAGESWGCRLIFKAGESAAITYPGEDPGYIVHMAEQTLTEGNIYVMEFIATYMEDENQNQIILARIEEIDMQQPEEQTPGEE